MTPFGSPIRRRRDGRYALRLDPTVRTVLGSVSEQVVPMLASGDESTRRLFPPAYVAEDHAAAEEEYRKLVDSALQNHHRKALDVLAATAMSDTLSTDELDAWLSAVESIRLVLGTRLDVGEEAVALAMDDPMAPELALYDLLGALQASIIDALAADLPDEGRPEGEL